MHHRRKRTLLILAKYISLIFTPFYLPIMGLVALFFFSYLSMYPLLNKVKVVLLVYIFTVLLPNALIYIYRKYQGWSILKLITRERRGVPYVISIACYFACFYTMNQLHIPHFMSSIVVAAIAIQIMCAIFNNWWKLSTHTAAIGGTTGAVAAFSLIFGFYPLWWICFLIIIAGVVGTSRTLLRIHTLGEVTGGYLIGLFSGFLAVVFS